MATISPATLDIGANGQYKAAQGTITVSKPAINTTATLNDAAVTFTHWLANVTDTASAAASLLVDLQVGGSSKFKVTKAGAGTFAAGVTATTGTFSGAVATGALTVTGAATVSTTLGVTGAATFSSTVAVNSTAAGALKVGNLTADAVARVQIGGITSNTPGAANSSALSLHSDAAGNAYHYVRIDTSHGFNLDLYTGTAVAQWLNVTANGSMATRALQIETGKVRLAGIGTTASAANAYIDNADTNNILRSTSSLRYKTDVSDLTLREAQNIVLNARPIRFRDKQRPERGEYIGLAAEQIHELDPRATTVDTEGRPDWVQYPHLTAPLMLVVQDLERRLSKYETIPQEAVHSPQDER